MQRNTFSTKMSSLTEAVKTFGEVHIYLSLVTDG